MSLTDPGSGDAFAVMLPSRADMLFDEVLRQAQIHHLHSQEEKPGFPSKRIVVEPECFNRRNLGKCSSEVS